MSLRGIFDGGGARQGLLASVAQVVGESERLLEAEVLTPPSLLSGGGNAGTYACDVKIPGQTERLRNVPISAAAGQVVYAAPGSAVTLERNPRTGKVEIIGFSKRKPGTYTRYSIDLSSGDTGAAEDVGLTSRLLTFEEIGIYAGGFGICPFGARGIFQGGTLIEVV